jgi:phosphatidylglycerol:prolipoprotein diacylglycerol transferase
MRERRTGKLTESVVLDLFFGLSAALTYPPINPFVFSVEIAGAQVGLRWYAVAYMAGLILGWRYMVGLTRRPDLWSPAPGATAPLTAVQVDDFLVWATLGVVVGGRLGHVFFYQPEILTRDPLAALRIWEGGMSFHGGLIGVVLAVLWMSRSGKIRLSALADAVAVATPIGLGLGRIANFINAELYGRASDVAWAMRFPIYDAHYQVIGYTEPRHPSQLYQAALEGLVLFLALRLASHRFKALQRPWLCTGIFLSGYALVRTAAELVRQPDPGLDALPLGLTMGMILSAPMLAIGLWLIVRALKRPPLAA